jgi:hypothetical protein
MKRAMIAALAVFAAGCASAPAGSGTTADAPTVDSAEHEAVLQVIDTFLLALGNGDRELQKSVELPDGMIAFSRITEAGVGGIRRMPQSAMQSQPGHDPFVEMYWDAKVDVRGPFAQVWAPYVLLDNGATVHCGIDAFQLIKQDGAWKIHGSLSTMEPGACDELGAQTATGLRPRDGWKETPNQ